MTTELKSKTGLSEDLQLKLDEADRLLESEDYVQASNKYKEVIKAESECVPALNKLAVCCTRVNAEDDAIAVLRRIVEIRPNNSLFHAKLARLLLKKEAFSEAVKEYKSAIGLNLEQPDWVFIGLGRAMQKLKKAQSPEAN